MISTTTTLSLSTSLRKGSSRARSYIFPHSCLSKFCRELRGPPFFVVNLPTGTTESPIIPIDEVHIPASGTKRRKKCNHRLLANATPKI